MSEVLQSFGRWRWNFSCLIKPGLVVQLELAVLYLSSTDGLPKHAAASFGRKGLSFVLLGWFLCRIEKMWVRDGAAYFFGPIFIHPEETEHEPTKMFYKKEVFLSNLEETCPMTCILGNY